MHVISMLLMFSITTIVSENRASYAYDDENSVDVPEHHLKILYCKVTVDIYYGIIFFVLHRNYSNAQSG